MFGKEVHFRLSLGASPTCRLRNCSTKPNRASERTCSNAPRRQRCPSTSKSSGLMRASRRIFTWPSSRADCDSRKCSLCRSPAKQGEAMSDALQPDLRIPPPIGRSRSFAEHGDDLGLSRQLHRFPHRQRRTLSPRLRDRRPTAPAGRATSPAPITAPARRHSSPRLVRRENGSHERANRDDYDQRPKAELEAAAEGSSRQLSVKINHHFMGENQADVSGWRDVGQEWSRDSSEELKHLWDRFDEGRRVLRPGGV